MVILDTDSPPNGPADDAPMARRARRRRMLAGGALVVAVAAIGIGVGPAGALDRVRGSTERPVHDRPADGRSRDDSRRPDHDCPSDRRSDRAAGRRPTSTTPAPTTEGPSVDQTVTVVVPPTIRVLEDERGRLTILTNAGRPPAAGDLVYLRQADGSYAVADAALAARVVAARWVEGPSWCDTLAEHRSRPAGPGGNHGGPPDRGHGQGDDRAR